MTEEEFTKQRRLIFETFEVFKKDFSYYESFAFLGVLNSNPEYMFPLINTPCLLGLREALDIGHFHLRSKLSYRLMREDINDPETKNFFTEEFGLTQDSDSSSLKWLTDSGIVDHFFFIGVKKKNKIKDKLLDREDEIEEIKTPESRIVLGWSNRDLLVSLSCARRLQDFIHSLIQQDRVVGEYDTIKTETELVDKLKKKIKQVELSTIPTFMNVGGIIVETPDQLFDRIMFQVLQILTLYKFVPKLSYLPSDIKVIYELVKFIFNQFLGGLQLSDRNDALAIVVEYLLKMGVVRSFDSSNISEDILGGTFKNHIINETTQFINEVKLRAERRS